MRVQSIRTAIEPGDPAGDGFLGAACQMAFGEVHRIAEAHHFARKIRPVTEALEDARHLLPPGLAPPLVVDFGDIAGSICVFDEADLCSWMNHSSSVRGLRSCTRVAQQLTGKSAISWESVEAG